MPYADVEKRRERGRRWRAKHRAEIRVRANQKRAASPEKFRRYAKAWRAKNTEKARMYGKSYMRKVDGLPIPTRPEPERCESCGNKPNGNTKGLHLDHCHETGAFRGWLCSKCNTGIGALGDCSAGVRNALRYLRRFDFLASLQKSD